MRILINLIGKEVIGNFRVFKYMMPDKVIHLYSSDTKVQNQNLTNTIQSRYGCAVESILVEDGFDYEECMSRLDTIEIDKANELIAHITGGTKIMSLALMAFATTKNQAKNICYFDTKQNLHWLNKASKDKVTTEIELEEYIELQGQKINSKVLLGDALHIFNLDLLFVKENYLLETWKLFLKEVVTPIRNYRGNWNNQQSLFSIISQNLVNLNSFNLTVYNGILYVKYKNEDYFKSSLSENDIDYFYFNAGWFELLTALALKKYHAEDKIYLSVKFPYLANIENDKNEVDILVIDNGKLIFIECKSGQVKSEHIDRIKNRKDTFGGLISQSTLITRIPLEKNFDPNVSKNLVEKCREFGIEYKTLRDISA